MPKSDYSYLEEFGDLRWHTRRVKAMRIAFKNYFLASAVATVFIFLQTVTVFFVVFQEISVYYQYVVLLANSMFQCFLMWKPIKNHLFELDNQVNYRIKRHSKACEKQKQANIEARNSLSIAILQQMFHK